ncbi:MAG: transketolase, partial [Anaerolineales bacterium]
MTLTSDIHQLSINTIRFLAADAVQQANSGHPGLPMGAAPMAYVLWTRFLQHSPAQPDWPNRDRFVLSGGHGSMLLYALLHLTGYDLPLEELIKFRQWGSQTPGHPEAHLTPGVETTTGPLGQGFANGVGMAMAEAHLAARFNRPDSPPIVDHYTYAIVTDGDLMEGVASEAASLAGHLRLGKLIYLYDDNHISIDGSTELAFTENRTARFEAYGWHTEAVEDGNDLSAIEAALQRARIETARPSLIAVRNIIGFGAPHKQNTSKAHGEPLGEEELAAAKRNLGWPDDARFLIPGDVAEHMRGAVEAGARRVASWNERFQTYAKKYPTEAAEYERVMAGELPTGWEDSLPIFKPDPKGQATRNASGAVINALAPIVPELIGGSADLAPSNKTLIAGAADFQADNYGGRNLRFGVREHAMGSILNGMAAHGGLIPYGGTFLVFYDYMRPPLRLAALSGFAPIIIYTHDSIGLGEDGPTHQAVEHLAALRAVPNLLCIRPCDANEVTEAWRVALQNRRGPTCLILTRQRL